MSAPRAAAEARRWVIDEIAPDFTLLDVWPLPVEGAPEDFAVFLEMMDSLDPRGGRFSVSRALFWVRLRLGDWLGWDDPTKRREIPGSAETTLRDRLPEQLRSSVDASSVAAAPRKLSESLRRLYRTDDEAAAEISNDTVHGVVHFAWIEHDQGRYRAQMSVYVKPRGARGRLYLRLIQPFRHLIVYPALLRGIERTWQARPGSASRRDRADLHPHERLLREFRAARLAGQPIDRFLAEDVVWHVPGHSLIAGEYRRKSEVLEYFERRQALAGGTFTWDVGEVLVGEQHVVELTTGRADRDGSHHEWYALGLVRIEQGRIAECWLLPFDPEAFDQAWS